MTGLEHQVRNSISAFFLQNERKEISNSLACEVPPEIVKEVIELLVAPTTVAILADFIIRKFPGDKSAGLCRQAEEIGMCAKKKIQNGVRILGGGQRQSKAVFDYVSEDVHVKIEMTQLDNDPEKLLDKMKTLINNI